MTCSTCGRENPAHLTFCQECGQRLGPRIAPPTPPIGLGGADAYGPPPGASAGSPPGRVATALGVNANAETPYVPPVTTTERRCKICDTVNGPNLRYCTSCGSTLEPMQIALSSAASAPAASPAAASPMPSRSPLPPAPAAVIGGGGAMPQPASAIAPMRVLGVGGGGAPEGVIARTCSRCRGVADTSAQFCKFCGASLADAQPAPGAQVSASPQSPMLPHERLDLPRANGSSDAPAQARIPSQQPTAAMPMRNAPAPSPSPIGGSSNYGPPPQMGAAAALASIPRPPSAPPPPMPSANQANEIAGGYGSPHGVEAQQRQIAPPTPQQPMSPSPSRAPAPPPQVSAPPSPQAGATTRGRLVVIAKSGADGPSYPFGDLLDIGRTEGNVVVAEDPYLSPRHVRIVFQSGKLLLRDLGSTNGVFLRLAPSRDTTPRRSSDNPEVAVPLVDNDLILVGQQVLRFDILREGEGGFGPAQEHGTLLFGSPAAPRYARLCQRTVEGIARDIYYVRKVETVLGRESGDVVFTEDPFLSRRHAAIRLLSRDGHAPGSSKPPPGEARFALVDLGSSNGTFLRIRGDVELAPGDHFRVGQQLFRVDFDLPPGARA